MRDDEKLQQQIADIGTRYLKRTLGELSELRACLQDARSKVPHAMKQLERMAHKIHGSGAMFGFDAVSEHAYEVEKLAASGQTDLGKLQQIETSLDKLEAQVKQEAEARGM